MRQRIRGKPIQLQTILDATLRIAGVGLGQMIDSQHRSKEAIRARALYSAGCREMTWASYPEIAQSLGRRHHSGVCTAEQRFNRLDPHDKERQLVQLAVEVKRIMLSGEPR